jgi:hypothetical protein
MRLSELNPKWVLPANWAAKDRPFYVAVSFDCPCKQCNTTACPTCGHKAHSMRLQFKFWPPIDPTEISKDFDFRREHHAWDSAVFDREGDTLEALTLTPHMCVEGHWNGTIVNGELIDGTVGQISA